VKFRLKGIDEQSVEHLTKMEPLRDSIELRGFGHRDAKQEFKKEGYDIFVTVMAAVSARSPR
jgi:preprotein translocase subunit SecA